MGTSKTSLPPDDRVRAAILMILSDGRQRTTTELWRALARRRSTKQVSLMQVTVAVRILRSRGDIFRNAEDIRKVR